MPANLDTSLPFPLPHHPFSFAIIREMTHWVEPKLQLTLLSFSALEKQDFQVSIAVSFCGNRVLCWQVSVRLFIWGTHLKSSCKQLNQIRYSSIATYCHCMCCLLYLICGWSVHLDSKGTRSKRTAPMLLNSAKHQRIWRLFSTEICFFEAWATTCSAGHITHRTEKLMQVHPESYISSIFFWFSQGKPNIVKLPPDLKKNKNNWKGQASKPHLGIGVSSTTHFTAI